MDVDWVSECVRCYFSPQQRYEPLPVLPLRQLILVPQRSINQYTTLLHDYTGEVVQRG